MVSSRAEPPPATHDGSRHRPEAASRAHGTGVDALPGGAPRSRKLFERARGSLLSGVPMHWMTEWAGAYPVFVEEARGARFVDVDGREYVDFCLGDTGAMAGHSPPAVADAVAEQVPLRDHGDASERGRGLVRRGADRRFGLPSWQFALTATDANRFTIRLAREITSRPKILVHAWCYHGSVDETLRRPRGRCSQAPPAHDRGTGRTCGHDTSGRDQRPRRTRA